MLGDDSLEAMLAGNAAELVAVGLDLFRQPGHTFAAGDDLLEQPLGARVAGAATSSGCFLDDQ